MGAGALILNPVPLTFERLTARALINRGSRVLEVPYDTYSMKGPKTPFLLRLLHHAYLTYLVRLVRLPGSPLQRRLLELVWSGPSSHAAMLLPYLIVLASHDVLVYVTL